MKTVASIFFGLFVLTICLQNCFAQPPQYPPQRRAETTNNENVRVVLERPDFGPKTEARIIKKGLLAPSPQDVSDKANFLKQSNTGLIRLLPREVYEKPVNGKKLIKIRGAGAFYSFYYGAHQYGFGSDLSLEQNQLLSGFAGADIGILTDLGDVAFDEIKLSDSRLTYLAQYAPPKNEPGARIEQGRALAGYTQSGMFYKRMLPLYVGSTYLVRSVIYHRSDVLVAFKVNRKDDDGSAIIVWKLLKKYKTPQLN